MDRPITGLISREGYTREGSFRERIGDPKVLVIFGKDRDIPGFEIQV